MNKKAWGYGTGALVLTVAAAAGGTFAFRHWAGRGPATAVASGAPGASATNDRVNSILDLVRHEKSAAASPTSQPSAPTTQPSAAATNPPPAARPVAPPPPRSVSPVAPAKPAAAGLTHDERVVLETVMQLQALRSAVATWKLQHDNHAPDFGKFPLWQQFTERDARGQALRQAPINPLNGESRVLPVQGDIKPGLTIKGGAFGYVYSLSDGKLWATDELGSIFDDGAIDTLALRARAATELSPKEAEKAVLAVLPSLRSQLAVYALQHDDRYPDFARYPAFEQLVKRTSADGRLIEGNAPTGGRVVGPYLYAVPVNATNGRYKVAVVNGGVRPGQKIDSPDAGFVFSKANGRLYATDAGGRILDEDKAAAAQSQGGAGRSAAPNVQTIRSQIALYRLQHEDRFPDLARFPRWEQLTGRTRTDGSPDPVGKYGPYLNSIPVNPRNGSSEVEAVEKIPDGWLPKRRVGFIYESSTGRVWMTDERWAPVPNQ